MGFLKGFEKMFKLLAKIQNLIERGMKKSYVSEAGEFLKNFDQKNPELSESQKKEIKKHENLFNRVRDTRVKWN